jgi:putative transposase
MDIIALLQVLSQCLDRTSLRRLNVIVLALVTMTGRVTMLGISRWAEKGGSYRTIQRFYNSVIPWGMVLWLFFKAHLHQPGTEYLMVGDESVVTKAGRQTHGLERFFSSIVNRPVAGVAFFALSLVSVAERKSYPLLVEQVIRTAAEKAASQEKKVKKAKKATQKEQSSTSQEQSGRRKGSKNKDKSQIEWSPELRRIEGMAMTLRQRMSALCPLRYFVLDGHFGNNNVMQMVRQSLSLHLISKLRNDSALYLLYDGPQKPVGRKRIYGPKLHDAQLPPHCLVHSGTEEGIQTDVYQATVRGKSFADPLNVVILLKTNLRTQKRAHVVLFSSDLALAYAQLIDAYQLRFQIEFNFRDAKQFWGLEDFMNIQPTPVTNAVGLAFLMVNLSQRLLVHFRPAIPDFSILDLKALFRARRYAMETLKLLPPSVDPILIDQVLDAMPSLGSIHPQHSRLVT